MERKRHTVKPYRECRGQKEGRFNNFLSQTRPTTWFTLLLSVLSQHRPPQHAGGSVSLGAIEVLCILRFKLSQRITITETSGLQSLVVLIHCENLVLRVSPHFELLCWSQGGLTESSRTCVCYARTVQMQALHFN